MDYIYIKPNGLYVYVSLNSILENRNQLFIKGNIFENRHNKEGNRKFRGVVFGSGSTVEGYRGAEYSHSSKDKLLEKTTYRMMA